MEDLQDQISELRNQLDHLNQNIESMPKQIISGLLTHGLTQSGSANSFTSISHVSISHVSRESLEYNFSHKDIIDEARVCVSQENQISSEWQIGRLTAQLTYAYERIAALEKQLLSRHLTSR